MNKTDARVAFEVARDTAEAIVTAQFGSHDPKNRKCNSLYFHVYESLLDERLRDWKTPQLMEYLYC
ncbi:hypothetical protein [Caballeronia grimmiae]|uniref:hypothetical protein n=1 Tax=Caballeronia grimmiae TaxID=1071679 RepID=UPI0038B9C8F8